MFFVSFVSFIYIPKKYQIYIIMVIPRLITRKTRCIY